MIAAEVLEHIPSDVEDAAREIARVARKRVIVGVPYGEDNRIGRITLRALHCGTINPPWGSLEHVQ